MEGKNVIILLVDALRTKNLSLFGAPKEIDKNLKEIAADNILFTQYFSVSNATAPAITSILTGLYPQHHGIIHQPPYTAQHEKDKVATITFWLPTYLREKGYETICVDWVGMWLRKGFDFYGEVDDWQPEIENRPFISAKETIDLAISRIKKSKKPFFLLTHFWDTHFPFPNTPYKSDSTEEDRIKTLNSIQNENQREYLRKRIMKANLYTLQEMTDKYELAIAEIDSQIGRLYRFLKDENMWENTIFFVMGDHGDNLTEHGIYFSHSGLFDDSIHVPMIAHIPGFKKQEINKFAQHVDLVPTILDLLELKTDKSFDGKSLMPLIKNDIEIRSEIFAVDGLCNDVMALRTKNRKLIIAKDSFCNLCKGAHHDKIEEYDLDKDPQETKNVYSGKSELMNLFNKIQI